MAELPTSFLDSAFRTKVEYEESLKLPPAERLLSAADATLSCGKPATVHGEHHTYNHSYELAESVTCCCSAGSAAHLDTHAANCAGRCAAGRRRTRRPSRPRARARCATPPAGRT